MSIYGLSKNSYIRVLLIKDVKYNVGGWPFYTVINFLSTPSRGDFIPNSP